VLHLGSPEFQVRKDKSEIIRTIPLMSPPVKCPVSAMPKGGFRAAKKKEDAMILTLENMTLTFVFMASIIAGTLFVLISLYYNNKGESTKTAKPLADLFMKLAIVTFGVFVAFIAFFGQKWLEDANKRIDDANEALEHLDIIQSQYMNDIETSYFNDECEFSAVVKGCIAEYENKQSNIKYCKEDAEAAYVSDETIINGIDYFDYPPEQSDFNNNLAESTQSTPFIARTVTSHVIREMFGGNTEISSLAGINTEEVKSINEDAKSIRPIISKKYTNKKLFYNDRNTVKKYAHSMCCSAINIYENSNIILKHADEQAKRFCDLRDNIADNTLNNEDPIIRYIARPRLNAMTNRIEEAKADGVCKFKPRGEAYDPYDHIYYCDHKILDEYIQRGLSHGRRSGADSIMSIMLQR
jgi:hypothetical protein